MKLAGFAERLAYARILVHFRLGRCITNTAIGAAVDRTQPWVTKWAKSSKPPKDFQVHEPLAAFLGVDEMWLIRGQGEPPERDLWDRWVSSRATKLVRRETEDDSAAGSSENKRRRRSR